MSSQVKKIIEEIHEYYTLKYNNSSNVNEADLVAKADSILSDIEDHKLVVSEIISDEYDGANFLFGKVLEEIKIGERMNFIEFDPRRNKEFSVECFENYFDIGMRFVFESKGDTIVNKPAIEDHYSNSDLWQLFESNITNKLSIELAEDVTLPSKMKLKFAFDIVNYLRETYPDVSPNTTQSRLLKKQFVEICTKEEIDVCFEEAKMSVIHQNETNEKRTYLETIKGFVSKPSYITLERIYAAPEDDKYPDLVAYKNIREDLSKLGATESFLTKEPLEKIKEKFEKLI